MKRQGRLGRELRPIGLWGLLSEKLGGLRRLSPCGKTAGHTGLLSPCGKTAGHSGLRGLLGLLLFLVTTTGLAQIKIGGNVYGGGNKGKVVGNTSVTVKAGNIGAAVTDEERPLENPLGRVFGGARMADVGGRSYVNIDGENATDYIVINRVYGGNDIAGHIGTSNELPEELNNVMPEPTAEELTEAGKTREQYIKDYKAAHPEKDTVDISWNSFVHISSKAADNKSIFIGQVFAGGNGYFDYEQEEVAGGKVKHTIYNKGDKTAPLATVTTEAGEVGFQKPEIDKAYLDIQGGTIDYAYGGGNNVTVKKSTVIHVAQPSDEVVTHVWVDNKDKEDATVKASAAASNQTEEAYAEANNLNDLLCPERLTEMGINEVFSFISSEDFQIGKLFGGNNLAEMDIMPGWNLQSGRIRNLYSGGNRGAMTSPKGLLLEIDPVKDLAINPKPLIVDNVYGGCRMADVKPTVEGVYTPTTNLPGYSFPNELSARTLVRGGDINNVYGGNDLTGIVYGGNAIGIYTTIRGDVYGGGNGAYPYTDIPTLEGDATYGDFYYSGTSSNSIDNLNAFRPNAEQVSIRLKGTSAENPTIIQGAVYVGGNCATLDTKKKNPLVELKIGSHVIADKVFMGNNGERMIDPTILERYKDSNFSTLNLTSESEFSKYMEGVAMNLQPAIVFDNTSIGDPDNYVDYTSKIGSFFCGGNVGSMAIPGKNTYEIDRGLVIFNKLVAGCNSADVPASSLNAAYEGGVLGSIDERDDYTEGGKIKDRIELNLSNLTIVPQRWNDVFTKVTAATTDYITDAGKLIKGEVYYKTDLRENEFIANGTEDPTTETYYKLTTVGTELEWNTAKWSTDENEFVRIGTGDASHTGDDADRRLLGGNIYGGCYDSGHVNGNVTVNINQDLVKRDEVFAEVEDDDSYTMKEGGERRSGVILDEQGDDVMSLAMTVFGGGCGKDTEIWGSATVNLNNGYVFQIFGGGEEGKVGKKTLVFDDDGKEIEEYVYNPAYSTTVNMKGPNPGYSEKESGAPLAETEYIYGGGNEGDVIGDSYVYLGDGRVYDAFGGASNANIYGATEIYVGHNGGFPWIRDNVYGGNDFGGVVRGKKDHSDVTTREIFDPSLLESSTYVKYIQGRVDSIFGGNYGNYDYLDRMYKDYTDNNGVPVNGFSFPHIESNSFVHFQPADKTGNKVAQIFGGSEGYPGDNDMNNAMQEESYVLIDDVLTKTEDRYADVDIYGGGAYAGVGHRAGPGETNDALGAGRTVVDLYAGKFNNVYGASNQEGLVGYARVNVPAKSTAKVNALFGGGKGYEETKLDETPELAARYCDTYVTCVDFQGANAIVEDAIYGGNQNIRIACDTYINIAAPVNQSSGYQATVYGAGYGKKTVSGRTNVFMNSNSKAYKVFGGGRDGNAFNFASLRQWLAKQYATAGVAVGDLEGKVTEYGNILRTFGTYLSTNPVNLPKTIGTYANAAGQYDGKYTNDILPTLEKPIPDYHNTNVHIMKGGNVTGYAYGGGFGTNACVAGSTYIELKGGIVDRDIYGGGQGGPVEDEFNLSKDLDATNDFVATTNVYIEGGMARNVYGGGYLGDVGKHTKVVEGNEVEASLSDDFTGDVLGVANIVIGKAGATDFFAGNPAVQRNAYGGGEGGSVYGTTNLTLNNGYIGYRCDNTGTEDKPVYTYTEVTVDKEPGDFTLGGNVFGGGYVVDSYVDIANINLYGGQVRGSVYGGGEVGPIGRGTMKSGTYSLGLSNGNAHIFKAGQTHVNMYKGHVLRNVFGGGRGKDSWGGDGRMFMSAEDIANADWGCKGYIFGQTDVNIYGGEIGTDDGVEQGFGNVFGGGDEGSVYSAYMDGNNLRIGKKDGKRYDGDKEGYYYKSNGTTFYEVNVAPAGKPAKMERIFTEDCHVLVEPHCKTTSPMTIGSENFKAGDYIPTSALSKLKDRLQDSRWNTIDADGIIIHNAVFAGGNIASGSSSMYANEKTVFGNATATIHDVYNRDLITIGTGHTGGLYGDGNLTFVDGYRELNITNYGTDYYHIATTLPIEDFKKLPVREQAYYEVKYKVKNGPHTDREGTTYTNGSTLPEDEILDLFDGISGMIVNGKPNPDKWEENGVVSTYAGRIMNTIQRADLCGVFGSRMVMKGAQDRVPSEVDYTNYTINRVREVSLNKVDTQAGDTDAKNILHGNYFGIYSIVNYLGALTSDVKMNDPRTTNADIKTYPALAADGTTTFAEWKEAHKTEKSRNNGTCHNQVALASGVYLELTTEESTGTSLNEKVWGPITGIVEMDLINVQPGIGGGFVYAKNQHGTPSPSGAVSTTLTALNKNAATKWDYTYSDTMTEEGSSTPTNIQKAIETSGNFIHSSQTIIDDCYNISNRYKIGEDPVPAHYWFISGSVYVYDQYISAYTGAPNAYSKTVEIPITINAASHGTMTLMDVKPNLYAYYATNNGTEQTKLGDEQKLVINDITYTLNSPISYWDWNKLSTNEKKLFVEDTYVVIDSCVIGTTYYPAGKVLLPADYEALKSAVSNHTVDGKSVKAVQLATVANDGSNMAVTDKDSNPVYEAFDYVFRQSNNMSHDTGYLLTYNMSNPGVWGQWYTMKTSSEGIKDQRGGDGFEDAPTYRLKGKDKEGNTITGILLGQREYGVGDIIAKDIYKAYDGYDENGNGTLEDNEKGLKQNHSSAIPSSGQATFVPAYVVTQDYASDAQHLYKGAAVSSPITGYTAPAYVCTSTIQLSETEYIYVNELITEEQKTTYYNKYHNSGTTAEDLKKEQIAQEIKDMIVPAFYCQEAGFYGGDYYQTGTNYRALAAWSSMSEADRAYFDFNYDALDLLIDPAYGTYYEANVKKMQTQGRKYQYDGQPYDWSIPSTATEEEKEDLINNMIYSLPKPIDYEATYNGTNPLTYTDASNGNHTVAVGTTLGRVDYEKLPNEQRHYAAIKVKPTDVGTDKYIYVVNTEFIHVETPYAVGMTIDSETYARLTESEQRDNITKLTFAESDLDKDNGTPIETTFYYCREAYKVNEKGEGTSVTVKGATTPTYTSGQEVPIGTLITQGVYGTLPNKQLNFTIHGESPMETSTLFVSRNSDINDLSTEKIITVIYKYDYEESDADGMHITPVSERHVVNIHVKFKSGVPTVADIREPGIVLPGTSITMSVPTVTPGAYEILGGGWELFEKASDAESHVNGKEYKPSSDSLYWYQDGFYLAYYAKTYLGKTYSNAVNVSVANYHDLKAVMDDKKHHLHVDYDRTRLKRDSKVYINNYSGAKDGLDLLHDFYDLSVSTYSGSDVDENGLIKTGTFQGHKPLNNSIETGTNIHDKKTYTKGVKAGTNLDFFLRTDIDHTGKSWTPIASGTGEPCFDGTLHGDGHTISNLTPATGTTGSLFGRLCGSVYNLGVMGSFAGAGVADEGAGYVESCWVKTDATTALSKKPYAVFGNPNDETGYQVVNSYFYEGNKGLYNSVTSGDPAVTTYGGARGAAKPMPERAFYNGELAYDLNNFYLYKRYCDKKVSTGADNQKYLYYTIGNDNKPVLQTSKYYDSNPDLCSSGYNGLKYVEERYADGDYIFANGSIPTADDERHHVETVTDSEGKMTLISNYYPIWPDDYIFFGQKLTYGYSTEAHQDVPTAVVKDSGRLAMTTKANRVYRAPAYYRSSDMGVAHFNPQVYLAQKENPETVDAGKTPREAYPGMTAIDFAGHNDTTWGMGSVSSGFAAGSPAFYPPLLDDDGLLSIANQDETSNLLVYAPAASGTSGYVNAKTCEVLNSYFTDPNYSDYYDDSKGYRRVDKYTLGVYGHLVQSDLTTDGDHLLVDKNDFNCPISYTFGTGKRMWYQRTPDDAEYVDHTKGWQGISLPFTAELVTTHQKGEITHFYSGSETSKNDTNTKIGHEYWLRNLTDMTESGAFVKGSFNYPTTSGSNKTVTNKFLWDYYYENTAVHNRKDKNNDDYQEYYSSSRTFMNYPLLTAATPYLLGLPGQTYYEFDLSGNFNLLNTASPVTRLEKQVLTFVSNPAITIGVSDTEMTGVTKTVDGIKYTYKPSYMNETITAEDIAAGNTYKLNAAGSQYDKITAATDIVAFRPYFTAVAVGSTSRPATRSIVFTNDSGDIDMPHDSRDADKPGTLHVSSGKHKILVTSGLSITAEVRIVTTSGITLSTFNIEPGETIETRVNSSGVYMVQSTDGRFIKKIAVR